jgi:hypothetical protein
LEPAGLEAIGQWFMPPQDNGISFTLQDLHHTMLTSQSLVDLMIVHHAINKFRRPFSPTVKADPDPKSVI